MGQFIDWLFNMTSSGTFAPPSYGAGTAPIIYIIRILSIFVGIGIGVGIGYLIWGL